MVTGALANLPFKQIWCVDFEFYAPDGERPDPLCLVARELRTGREIRLWQDELRQLSTPPYPIDEDSLIVTYYGSAEAGCHQALGWEPPARHLDLFTEYRVSTNGLPTP